MSSKFWTICLLALILIGSCLVMSGCGKAKKDEPESVSNYTTWDNGSVTYWENIETEDIIVEDIIVEEIKEIEIE